MGAITKLIRMHEPHSFPTSLPWSHHAPYPQRDRAMMRRMTCGFRSGVRLVAILVAAIACFAGCDEALGIVRIHFSLRPPRVIDLGEDAGPPPVDRLDLSRAAGTLEVFVDIHHLSCEMTGLPAPEDPDLVYHLWLSDSERGGGWVLASPVHLLASGAGSAHLDQDEVAIAYATVRAGIVSLDEQTDEEPSRIVVLTGAVGQDPETETETGSGGGAPVHQH